MWIADTLVDDAFADFVMSKGLTREQAATFWRLLEHPAELERLLDAVRSTLSEPRPSGGVVLTVARCCQECAGVWGQHGADCTIGKALHVLRLPALRNRAEKLATWIVTP